MTRRLPRVQQQQYALRSMTDQLPSDELFPSLLRHVPEPERFGATENVRWLVDFLLRIAARMEREQKADAVDMRHVQTHPEGEHRA